MNKVMKKIKVTNLKKLSSNGGSVMHALKSSEQSFSKFGEAYFSLLESGTIRAWKYHTRMISNIIVPYGSIKFVFYEDDVFKEIIAGENNYIRITIPPKIWFGFMCVSKKKSFLLNIANILHDDSEVLNKDVKEINYDWTN